MNELVILYEDNHIIVVLKPQNIPSCEDESGDLDMLTMVKNHVKENENKSGNVFVGLVHRLDRPTGGVMLFAKSSKAAARLAEQMKTGDFEKKYYAVLEGIPKQKKATLVHYIKKNAINNMVYTCSQTTVGAKYASLEYQIVGEYGNYSLADITLHTGRSHQIRVQMNAIGTPLFGDMKYGKSTGKKNLALWAHTLSFTHPVLKERMVFKIEPPLDSLPWKAFDISALMALIK